MFYHVMPNGYPMPFESFEAFFAGLVEHAEKVEGVRIPQRRDFYCSEYAEGFFGLPMKIWERHGKFIGYEF